MIRICVISKYGLAPCSRRYNRLFDIASILATKNRFVTLITSISCGYSNDLNEYSEHWFYYEKFYSPSLRHVLIKGPKIKLGLSPKRIYSWIHFEFCVLLFLIINRFNWNILYVSSLSLLTVLNGVIYKTITAGKFLFEVRDIWPASLIEITSKKNLATYLLSKVEQIGYKKADKIISPLNNFDQYLKLFRENFERKFVFIPQNFYTESKDSFQNKPIEARGVCYAGSFGEANDVKGFVKLLSSEKINKNIPFYFIGRGREFEDLKRTYSNSQIHFLNYMNEKKLDSFLKRNCIIGLHFIPNREVYNYGISPNKWKTYNKANLGIVTFDFLSNNMLKENEIGFSFEYSEQGIKKFLKLLESTVFMNSVKDSIIKFDEYSKTYLNLKKAINDKLLNHIDHE